MATRRAAAGGEFVGGKQFRGGQFIGAEYIARELGQFEKKIVAAVDRAQYNSLRHAAFSISKRAKASIKKSNRPSLPGQPPTTRAKGRHNIRGAVFTSTTKESAIIGPRASFVGDVGKLLEHGKPRRGAQYKARPFMFPALEASQDRFASSWRGTIGE